MDTKWPAYWRKFSRLTQLLQSDKPPKVSDIVSAKTEDSVTFSWEAAENVPNNYFVGYEVHGLQQNFSQFLHSLFIY